MIGQEGPQHHVKITAATTWVCCFEPCTHTHTHSTHWVCCCEPHIHTHTCTHTCPLAPAQEASHHGHFTLVCPSRKGSPDSRQRLLVDDVCIGELCKSKGWEWSGPGQGWRPWCIRHRLSKKQELLHSTPLGQPKEQELLHSTPVGQPKEQKELLHSTPHGLPREQGELLQTTLQDSPYGNSNRPNCPCHIKLWSSFLVRSQRRQSLAVHEESKAPFLLG